MHAASLCAHVRHDTRLIRRLAGGNPGDERRPDTPTLAEDVLLLLFQPDSGTVAGETTPYTLAGAVLADLALGERVTTATDRLGGVRVEAVAGRTPSDELLRSAWAYVADKPRGVQTVLAAIGPPLRAKRSRAPPARSSPAASSWSPP